MEGKTRFYFNCALCGGVASKTGSHTRIAIASGSNNVYCNKTCQNRAVEVVKSVYNCTTCGVEVFRKPSEVSISGKVFCSRSCSAKNNNVGMLRNKPTILVCLDCGKDYHRSAGHRSKLLCIDCVGTIRPSILKHGAKTLADLHAKASVLGKHPSWKNVEVRSFARTWNRNLLYLPCQKCGYTKKIELCHIKAVTTFPETATIAEINSPENLLVLCARCHWEFDNGVLLLKEIPNRGIVEELPRLDWSVVLRDTDRTCANMLDIVMRAMYTKYPYFVWEGQVYETKKVSLFLGPSESLGSAVAFGLRT